MKKFVLSAVLYLTVFIAITSIFAHDTWLVPATFHCAPGDIVAVDLATGMKFPASESAVSEDRIDLFEAIHEKMRLPLSSFTTTNEALRGSIQIPEGDSSNGTWMLVTSLKPRMIELSAADFNDYLLHDGLKRIHDYRAQHGLLEQDAVERYTKHAKTLVQVGEMPPDKKATQPSGQTIEIVPTVNPYSLKKGYSLSLKILFRGKPLAGAELAWTYPEHGEGFAGSITCDEEGRAIIPLQQAGPLLLRTIHMEHVQHPEYEWESHWASLTFEVPDGN